MALGWSRILDGRRRFIAAHEDDRPFRFKGDTEVRVQRVEIVRV